MKAGGNARGIVESVWVVSRGWSCDRAGRSMFPAGANSATSSKSLIGGNEHLPPPVIGRCTFGDCIVSIAGIFGWSVVSGRYCAEEIMECDRLRSRGVGGGLGNVFGRRAVSSHVFAMSGEVRKWEVGGERRVVCCDLVDELE